MNREGSRGRGVMLAAAVAGAALLWITPAAQAGLPYIHAHRGGTLSSEGGDQHPVLPEETLGTFQAAADDGFVLEIDVKLTADGVPVVIHDATLDRTTNCEGQVSAITAADLRAQCIVDLAGTEGDNAPLPAGDPLRAPVPTLAEVLDLAKSEGSQVNLEIKNVPTDPDFDAGVPPAFAETVADVVKQSGFPPSWLIVQSFWPANLDVIEDDPYFTDTPTSFLTLAQTNDGGPAFADANGYEYISPAWPVSPGFIQQAHALGLQVVPYTVDSGPQIRTAAQAGVDAIITNDPHLARKSENAVEPPLPPPPPPPSAKECRDVLASNQAPPIESYNPDDSGPRVFAMQFMQEIRNVTTYERFRAKIECLILEYVKPRLADDRPNVVALTEDVGLMTLATGSRGAAARSIFSNPDIPSCENQPAPCGVAVAIGAIQAGYADQINAYKSRYPDLPPIGSTFVGGTDTFARGWMQTFSDLAKRYDIYILGSNDQAPFRESVDPVEVEQFADPDLADPQTAYVATRPLAYNEAFMWGPKDVRDEGPRPLRNVVNQNKKIPLTDIEQTIELEPGPRTGPDVIENLRPYKIPGTRAKMTFATSLPAFVYNGEPVSPYGEAPPEGTNPCSDAALYYMYCLERLGTNLVMQDEANSGRWANLSTSNGSEWQPLEWMSSTWRSSADPTVSFDYNVTPHMVGNLADLVFDGQTAITQRGLGADAPARRGCFYVGDSEFMPGPPENDPAGYEIYSGPKTEFLGLAPWVVPDAGRDELRAVGDRLAPASGDELENGYVETAVIADLPFPPDPDRPFCNRGSVDAAGRCANLRVGTSVGEMLRGGPRGDRLKGLAGDDRLRGRSGRDCLFGGDGDDDLQGGKDSDLLRGGGGPDEMHGAKGNDRLFAAGGGRDVVDCGLGRDRVVADGSDVIRRDCERAGVGISSG